MFEESFDKGSELAKDVVLAPGFRKQPVQRFGNTGGGAMQGGMQAEEGIGRVFCYSFFIEGSFPSHVVFAVKLKEGDATEGAACFEDAFLLGHMSLL